ncbi:MAG: alpha/beta fold hydrolase [Chloroflexota bacterium]
MTHTLTRKNCTLHYWLSGPTDAPVVVFTHGALIDHTEWDHTVPLVVDAGFRVLTWDVRGHGLSRPAAFDLLEAVQDLLAILDAVGAAQAILVGHSMGGNLGQEVVFRYPERVKALVMLDCTWNFQRLTSVERFMLNLAGPVFRLYPYDWLVDQSIAMVAKSADARTGLRAVVRRLTKAEIVQIMMALAVCLHEEPGYCIEKPMLMLLGEQDPTGNIRKIMPQWAKHEPNCEFHVIPNALHAPNLDQPEIFQGYLINFLQRLR